MGQERCGKWMPRKKTTCARTPGHGGPCKTAETMERNRLYNRDHPHRESPESRKKSNRKYRISSYGLTQEQSGRLLAAQQHACGMCHEPFEEGQLIHVDHDHACCRGKNRSCGKCIRGLLCHTCNIALGYIERRYVMARAYLDSPPVRLQEAAGPAGQMSVRPVPERGVADAAVAGQRGNAARVDCSISADHPATPGGSQAAPPSQPWIFHSTPDSAPAGIT